MIRVLFTDDCPGCGEEIDTDLEDVDWVQEYQCGCGTQIEFTFSGSLNWTARPPKKVKQ